MCTVGFSKVIWLGDLNYRIALSYADTKKLLMENDWDALFEKDQVTFLSRQERACDASLRVAFLLGKRTHQKNGDSSKYGSFK